MISVILAALFIFSSNASTPGSAERALPSQGRNLTTGEVVVGLHASTPLVRASCGWFEVVDGAKPPVSDNEELYVSGYDFNAATGYVTKEYSKRSRPLPVHQYSKLRCVAALKNLGLWDATKAWIIENGLYDEYLAAQDFSSDNEYFLAGKAALQQALGLSDEEIAVILQEAEL